MMGGHRKSQSTARLQQILEVFQKTWGHAVCELDFENAYQLTTATILSAQSTDKRVNMVTPALFERFPTPDMLAKADPGELETLVHSTGFFRAKSRNLLGMARMVVEKFGGEIPRTMDEMVQLPGVARKTGNVVLGTAYGIPSGIAVDTHVKRVTNKLALTKESNPVKIERDLIAQVPRDRWIDFSHQVIWHGRRICHARKPDCGECPLMPLCPSAEIT